MAQSTHYDVIIIGTGAGGGTLAYRLAPSGKRILLLERGGYLPREKDNWDSRAVFVENDASRRLLAAVGFREVGVYERHARLDGEWRDCVIVERLIGEDKCPASGITLSL